MAKKMKPAKKAAAKVAVKKAVKKQVSKNTTKGIKTDNPVIKEASQIYAFMQDHDLGTLEYQQKGVTIRLVRAAPAQVAVPVAVGGGAAASSAAAPAAEQYKLVIKSPLMGIFFRGSSPSAPPFKKEGEKVKAGEVLCLIEAMKVFNEVKAEFDCVIKKVIVDNGKPVKVGDALFSIERL
ncbi:acetyl-CoA carboxylase biotin carboxyl carrier protein [Parelusimicrobium proximum]|uniref:acetyl-CoA carboxylase biotin carboxyl carrier protein n=1 Tax=Parelusimicrobium proximum TaxID=3228953 RepID=UPI003D17A78D